MPDFRNGENRDFSRFDAMADDELEMIIRQDAQNPEGTASDLQMLLYIMEVLAKRKRKKEPEMRSAEEAFAEFEAFYLPEIGEEEPLQVLPRKKSAKRWLRAVAAAAAAVVVIVLGTVTTNAFGYDIWGKLFGWTDSSFYLVDKPQTEEPGVAGHKFDTLQDALDHFGIPYALEPGWLPDGYEFGKVNVMQSPIKLSIQAAYYCGEDRITFCVDTNVEGSELHIEAEPGWSEQYESEGVLYHILRNEEKHIAVWAVGDYECYISGKITVEELKRIVDSLGG